MKGRILSWRSFHVVGLLTMSLSGSALARGGAVHVRGYVTRNGTYVAPHYRSAPDHDPWNNWSTIGNVNPYTGKAGTKVPYSYGYYGSRYSTPSYVYRRRSGGAAGSYIPTSNALSLPSTASIDAVVLPSSVVKIPAKTKSGYCLQLPNDYVATGDLNYPVVTVAMPRCEQVADVKKRKKGLVWVPLQQGTP